jgi:hypothetical protein
MPMVGISGEAIDKFTGIRKSPDEIKEWESHHIRCKILNY